MNYRITKETTSITNEVTYYVEKQHKFLLWKWWSKCKFRHPIAGDLVVSYNTLAEAQAEYNRLIQTIKYEVVK